MSCLPMKYLILIFMFLLSACDGGFNVKKDVQFKSRINRECIKTSVRKFVGESPVKDKSSVDGLYLSTSKKILDRPCKVIVYQKPGDAKGIEIHSFGIIAPTKEANEQYTIAANEVISAMAHELEVQCGVKSQTK